MIDNVRKRYDERDTIAATVAAGSQIVTLTPSPMTPFHGWKKLSENLISLSQRDRFFARGRGNVGGREGGGGGKKRKVYIIQRDDPRRGRDTTI